MKINQFGDLTEEEFKEMMMMKEMPDLEGTLIEFDGEDDVPDSVDWRKVGAVTDVKHQQQCGSLTEDGERFSVFQSNLRFIEDHNDRFSRGETSYSMKINQFGDLTEEEFKEMMMMKERPDLEETLIEFDGEDDVPDSVDWRKVGAVTDVKQQNPCGACWAFTVIEHGKTYRSLSEDEKRFSIFQSNLRFIEDHNDRFSRGETSYSMKINQFGDLTAEEFKEMMMMERPELDETLIEFDGEGGDVPDSVDWRKFGAVTSVKNQLQCRSCWAFTAGAVEGQVFIKDKKLESLSPQNLVDCAQVDYKTYGCRGGWQTEAFKYVRDHANKGPISATLDMSGLQFYNDGVLDNSICKTTVEGLNHAVLLVGYEKDYYIAKNSWGPGWAAYKGFFNILRNNNTCGISLLNSFPIM
ncbi:unnamed protein product [Callosobruchus maculatus]|uniref:Peptidase C1A papain C-terminal domain-containing protein n=1 Tax=Callosobruchus maculatus TaxID=64391 RepID=A0A653C6V0_CALMS|nr:unnamed protein product [Callosobruchus maculatus]